MTSWLLAIVAACAASGAIGYWQGVERGELNVTAEVDHAAVNRLTGLLDDYTALTADANAASQRLRKATQARAAQDRKTTQELRDALAQQADVCADFRYGVSVMQQLDAAWQRAADAAAGGLDGAVPSAE
ncbi:hypothetical protein [Alloalcanivorax xenomutans]|uniref:Uncharacterized protein n=1 Tax=Alloalcanivorax xenomutans TaxID=1094342 RepID=A0A9Q3ZFZ3_9GAMM|nr:hypothetical protein [Alloalcanivorax xenomutans]MCE7510286.1 hypothetical protein [Alloalcanivorax xenomutans]